MSVSVPNRIRATVEVIATIETCVAAEVGTLEGSVVGEYRVPMMVPRLVMNASPGPLGTSQFVSTPHVVKTYPKRRKIPPQATTLYGP
jgi:hypothetical protein